jgi:hypothetical protein
VVKEQDVVQILEQISEKMIGDDVLSLIMVDKKQFIFLEKLALGEENEQGISKFFYLKTKQHYKTVITNSEKFVKFMTSLGLTGDIVDIIDKGKSRSVAFLAYKSLKKP